MKTRSGKGRAAPPPSRDISGDEDAAFMDNSGREKKFNDQISPERVAERIARRHIRFVREGVETVERDPNGSGYESSDDAYKHEHTKAKGHNETAQLRRLVRRNLRHHANGTDPSTNPGAAARDPDSSGYESSDTPDIGDEKGPSSSPSALRNAAAATKTANGIAAAEQAAAAAAIAAAENARQQEHSIKLAAARQLIEIDNIARAVRASNDTVQPGAPPSTRQPFGFKPSRHTTFLLPESPQHAAANHSPITTQPSQVATETRQPDNNTAATSTAQTRTTAAQAEEIRAAEAHGIAIRAAASLAASNRTADAEAAELNAAATPRTQPQSKQPQPKQQRPEQPRPPIATNA